MEITPKDSIAFSIQGLVKSFADSRGRVQQVIENLAFEISSGESLCIVGKSGTGKSTLLKLLAGLIPPSHGTIRYKNAPPALALQTRKFGFVFQNSVALPWRNVLQNACLPLEVGAQPERREAVLQLLAQVGLIDDLAKYPAELSGGMEQRLNFVMALALDPDVLFLDEPFGSLDTVTRRQLQELLQRIVHVPERKTTMVFVTHDLQEACYMANRVLIMRQSPVTNGTLAEVHVEAALPRSAAILYEAEFVRISQRVHVLMDGAVE